MNKTLLLIICDFLLLNLLALTRWEELPEQQQAMVGQSTPDQTIQQVVEEDLVAALRVTLDEERGARDAIGEQLNEAREALSEREESLAEREQRLAAMQTELQRKADEAARLNERVSDTQASVVQLSDRLAQTAEQAARSRAQAEQLAEELRRKQESEVQLQQQLQEVEQARVEAQERAQALETQVQVVQTERAFLRENVETLQTQVTEEREERLRLQQQTGNLAEGVTQLAANSANLRDEIRSSTPINANTLFDQFLANRVSATFHAARGTFFGPVTRDYAPRTILVTNGEDVFALFHANDTSASLRENSADWETLTGTLRRGTSDVTVDRLQFLQIDPRVVVAPVDSAEVTALGAKIFPTALEPFKFPEAVLVSGGGEYYGEVEFRLDPQTPGYVKMQSRVLSRLFGEFSPSVGDLVFSKTGEILGVMVNRNYCVVIDNFSIAAALPMGADLSASPTGDTLAAQKARVERLPLRLQ